MDRYLDSASSTRSKGVAHNRSGAAGAAPRATASRLSTLLGKPRPAPAKGLDVAVIDSLSVGDGEPATKRPKRLSRSSGGDGSGGRATAGASDATGPHKGECLDITASPPQKTTARPTAASRSSRGGGGASEGFGARFGNGSSRGSRSVDTNGGAKRKSSSAAASRGGGARGGSSIGGGGSSSSSKMGPWARRPEEKAICTEEGYDPLELMEDANREIFGNDSFRGIQEEVRERLIVR